MSAQGVVVLRAKKRENGSMPSLAISCLTDPKYQSSLSLRRILFRRLLTSRCRECHDDDVPKYRECYNS